MISRKKIYFQPIITGQTQEIIEVWWWYILVMQSFLRTSMSSSTARDKLIWRNNCKHTVQFHTCIRHILASYCLGLVSIYDKTSYRKISWSLEAARFVFRIVRSLWNLTGNSAALLPKCLLNFKAMRYFKVLFTWLRDLTRSYDKTPYRILKWGSGAVSM